MFDRFMECTVLVIGFGSVAMGIYTLYMLNTINWAAIIK